MPEVLEADLLDFKYELRCFWCCDIFSKVSRFYEILVNFRTSNSAAMFVFKVDDVDDGGLVLRNEQARDIIVTLTPSSSQWIFPLGVFRFLLSVKATNINMADTEKSVKIEEGDPQSVQDLTGFVPFDIHQVILFFNLIPGIYVQLIFLTNRSFCQ